ncbi:MAG: molybdate ABC transporter substrate-binding protein [Chlorobiaceae bacterium]|nr:molybdate ABC transporter substrate-binding protein [Chlorobiaceae bacterium]NTW73430.1 molybdate ABC transporter substrate-binding protein [Chlorobiaceae bacterium]
MKHRTLQTLLSAILAAVISTSAMAGEIRLSAGAGMKDVLNELADTYAKKHPGITIIRNWGPSGALAAQIENGAPTDLFISANQKWAYYLRDKTLLDNTRIAPFAWNSIVVIGDPASGINSMDTLAKASKIAMGNPRSAPAGEMAMEAIRKAGMEKALEGKIVLAKDVLESLMYAETGTVDASFVHRTEAMTAKKAQILFRVPQELYARVPYTMGVTSRAASNPEVTGFFEYLNSAEAKAVLKKWGYELK